MYRSDEWNPVTLDSTMCHNCHCCRKRHKHTGISQIYFGKRPRLVRDCLNVWEQDLQCKSCYLLQRSNWEIWAFANWVKPAGKYGLLHNSNVATNQQTKDKQWLPSQSSHVVKHWFSTSSAVLRLQILPKNCAMFSRTSALWHRAHCASANVSKVRYK